MANPFDDNAGDEYFGKPSLTKGPPPVDDGFNEFERELERTLQGTKDSTQRSLQMLGESEAVGVATAEDLVRQGEQLRKAEGNVDAINATTAQTQKHLNNVKSVFGGIKNYFSRDPAKQAAPTQKAGGGGSRLEGTISNLKAEGPGAALTRNDAATTAAGRTLPQESRDVLQGTRWGELDKDIDDNLDNIAEHLANLRGLGSALGTEVEEQNKVLERLHTKTEKSDAVIRDQDKQMRRLLGTDRKKAPKIKGGADAN